MRFVYNDFNIFTGNRNKILCEIICLIYIYFSFLYVILYNIKNIKRKFQ